MRITDWSSDVCSSDLLTWNDYVKVRSGKNLFYADGYAACTGKDKWDGCATKNYVGLSAKFTAVWYQVFPNIDLQLPVSVRSVERRVGTECVSPCRSWVSPYN